MSLKQEKLAKLIEIEGCEDELTFMEGWITASVCPAICMNPDCSYTEEMEPDQDRGWCPECKTNTLMSELILGGII